MNVFVENKRLPEIVWLLDLVLDSMLLYSVPT